MLIGSSNKDESETEILGINAHLFDKICVEL